MAAWSLAVPDWRERIRTGRSLLPDLPHLDKGEANRPVAIWNKLRLPDVTGTPALAEAGADWFRRSSAPARIVRSGCARADDPRDLPAGAEEEFEDEARRGADGHDEADEPAATGGVPADGADGVAGAYRVQPGAGHGRQGP